MTVHCKLDCLCPTCGAVFMPIEHGEACYKCGAASESRDSHRLLEEVAVAIRDNRDETGLPISAAYFIISGGDHYISHAASYLHFAGRHAFGRLDEAGIDAYLEQLNDVYDEPLDKALAEHLRLFLRKVAMIPMLARGDP